MNHDDATIEWALIEEALGIEPLTNASTYYRRYWRDAIWIDVGNSAGEWTLQSNCQRMYNRRICSFQRLLALLHDKQWRRLHGFKPDV